METVNHLTAFVQAGALSAKDGLRTLKEPLKRDASFQLVALNILDGVVMTGPMSIPTEVAGKKWLARLHKAASTSPTVSRRVHELLNRWAQQFQANPSLRAPFIAAADFHTKTKK
jgi:hypothetical protein